MPKWAKGMYVRNWLIAGNLVVLKPRTDTLAEYAHGEESISIPVPRDRKVIASRVAVTKGITWRNQGIGVAQEELARTRPVETDSVGSTIVPIAGYGQILIVPIWELIVAAARFVAIAEIERAIAWPVESDGVDTILIPISGNGPILSRSK